MANFNIWTILPVSCMKGEASTMLPELISEDTTTNHVYLNEILKQTILFFIGCVALFAGLLNIVTFVRMDLSQGVNLNLLLLSVSDLWVVATSISGYICSFLQTSGHYFIAGIPLLRVWIIFNAMLNYPMNISFVVTTVIAVVRCLCVTMPLSFRDIVTSCRQAIIIVVGSCISISAPLYVHLYFHLYKAKLDNNSSEIVVVNLRVRNALIFDMFRTTFYFTCFAINFFSMIFLSIALKRSSRFQASTVKTKQNEGEGKAFSVREAQVMKTIILLLAVFFFCNLPSIVYSTCRQIIPEFTTSRQYYNWKQVVDFSIRIGILLNAALNTPVYFVCNNRYHTLIKSTFCKNSV